MEQHYRCTIELVPLANMPLPYTGTTFRVPGYIAIFYRDDVAPSHMQHIICHELHHIICNHQGHACQKLTEELAAELVDCLPTGYHVAQWRVCSRTNFDQPEEIEAECGGTYLKNKLISADDAFVSFVLDL
jgi:hypothetical protein